MARTKRIIEWISRRDAIVLEAVTETFTHKQSLADGRVIRADPPNNFWLVPGASWYGAPPKEWEPSKAVEEVFTRRYESEKDYS